ncbi:MAG: PEP-utilizing enzyme [Patescibacteria group bacterium]
MDNAEKYFVQRMDGVLLLSFIAAEAEVVNVRRDFGTKLAKPFSPGVNAHGRINYFGYLWPDVDKQARAVINTLRVNPHFLSFIFDLWHRRVRALKRLEQNISIFQLKRLDDDCLGRIFRTLINRYQEQYSPSLLCDAFGLYVEKVITTQLKHIVSERGEERKLAHYLEILTAPRRISWATKEEIELLRIAALCKRKKRLASLLCHDFTVGKKEFAKDKVLADLLDTHTRKYFWLQNSYGKGVKLSRDYFLRRIRTIIRDEGRIEDKIQELFHTAQRYRQKKHLMAKLKIDHYTCLLLEWIESFGFLHDARKAVMMEAHYWITIVLREIGRRLGLTLSEMYYTDHHKIETMLRDKRIARALIHERMKLCAYVIWPSHYRIVVGRQAHMWHERFLGGTRKAIGELKGVSAASGVAVGNAKVVRDVNDGRKIKPDDILVTGMTRPHWMPFLKKVKAIVTDEGGITCHAAIVAREMHIPCIIGTKVATRVLHDNDLIEVNTNHHCVRIIKKGSL